MLTRKLKELPNLIINEKFGWINIFRQIYQKYLQLLRLLLEVTYTKMESCAQKEVRRSKPCVRLKESAGQKQDRRPMEQSVQIRIERRDIEEKMMFDRMEMFHSSFRNWDNSDELW